MNDHHSHQVQDSDCMQKRRIMGTEMVLIFQVNFIYFLSWLEGAPVFICYSMFFLSLKYFAVI